MVNRRRRGALFLLPAALSLWAVGCSGAGIDGPALVDSALATFSAGPLRVASPSPTEPIAPPPTLEPPVSHPTATLTPQPAAPNAPPPPTAPPSPTEPNAPPPTSPPPASRPTATPTPQPAAPVITLGNSAGGRPILAYRFGAGETHLVLVGGIHGGYEWNTILLAQTFIDHFRTRATEIPAALTIHIVPNANPDGLAAVATTSPDGSFQATDVISDTLAGRFNANGVDLNRNWDCNWTEQAVWRDQPVPAGAYPFSEPESILLRDFFLALEPALVIFLHSAAGAVYVSGCPEPDTASAALAAVYGLAAGYPVYPIFDHYPITGDAGDWLTTQGIPSFTVELATHEALDWEWNVAGLAAVMAALSSPGLDNLTDHGATNE